MARSKNLKHYPEEMLEAIDFINKNKDYEIETSGIKESLSIRAQFYAFFAALREEAKRIKVLKEKGETNPDQKVIAINADIYDALYRSTIADQLIIQAHENKVTFTKRSDTPLAQKLRATMQIKSPDEKLNEKLAEMVANMKFIEKTLDNGTVIKLPYAMTPMEIEDYIKLNYVEKSPPATEENSPETFQELSESTNWDKAIAQATGTEKRRLKRFKRLAEKRVEFFGKKES